MFNYICLGTNDLDRGIRFYDAALGALGYARCDLGAEAGWEGWAGWGTYQRAGADELALWLCRPFDGAPATPGNGVMVALSASSWRAVDEFHRAALAMGGACAGPPGLRTHYNPDFYAAYVRDPDGNKLAAVCRGYTAPAIEP
jgi:catechol 2,3-dioxygenase-like lactoylglutathione lyase family enzyme